MSTVAIHSTGSIAVLTIDRPRAANAIDPAVSHALVAALTEAGADPAITGAVLTGAGTRVFCAGIDLKNPGNLPPHRLAAERSAGLQRVCAAILHFPKPLVAAVAGAAIGAGFMLALLADRTIAADTARFSLPEIDHGMPTPIGLALLQEAAGGALAADLVLTGRTLPAQEAGRLGLVTCVPAPQVQTHAIAAAQDLARKPARAFAQNKDWIQRRRRAVLAEAERDSASYRLATLQAEA